DLAARADLVLGVADRRAGTRRGVAGTGLDLGGLGVPVLQSRRRDDHLHRRAGRQRVPDRAVEQRLVRVLVELVERGLERLLVVTRQRVRVVAGHRDHGLDSAGPRVDRDRSSLLHTALVAGHLFPGGLLRTGLQRKHHVATAGVVAGEHVAEAVGEELVAGTGEELVLAALDAGLRVVDRLVTDDRGVDLLTGVDAQVLQGAVGGLALGERLAVRLDHAARTFVLGHLDAAVVVAGAVVVRLVALHP